MKYHSCADNLANNNIYKYMKNSTTTTVGDPLQSHAHTIHPTRYHHPPHVIPHQYKNTSGMEYHWVLVLQCNPDSTDMSVTCVPVHVYAHVRANVFVYVRDCTYVFVDVSANVCMCMCVRMCMFVCLRCVHAHAHPQVRVDVYKNVLVYDLRTTPPHRNLHLFVRKR